MNAEIWQRRAVASPRASRRLPMALSTEAINCCVLLAAEHAEGARVASFDEQLTKAASDRNLEAVTH